MQQSTHDIPAKHMSQIITTMAVIVMMSSKMMKFALSFGLPFVCQPGRKRLKHSLQFKNLQINMLTC